MEIEEFKEAVETIFRIQFNRETTQTQFYCFDDLEFKLKKKSFREAVDRLSNLKSVLGYELCSKQKYEVSLAAGNRFYIRRHEQIEKIDAVNGISYKLGVPSDEYLLFLLQNLTTLAESETLRMPMIHHNLRRQARHRGVEEMPTELFDILKGLLPRFITLRIESNTQKSLKEFENLGSSFLFTLGYNTDRSYLPSNITDDFTRAVRINRLRTARVEEIEPPKRRFEQDIILFYQKAISSESVDLQYLSFYHVMEHFFEAIYNADMLQSIRDKITTPRFSYKRDDDLTELVSVIQDKLRYKNEEFQINEPEALLLVLDKYVDDLSLLSNDIRDYDEALISHYKTKNVSFSRGNKVNFATDRQEVLTNLRERIYRTRNSIVHSKENNKSKYLPFKHDRELGKELILMRLIAERIIIGSSKEL